ncbi:MAG: hypothetical protein N2C14_08975, partial [Planctomycetales bacterium]
MTTTNNLNGLRDRVESEQLELELAELRSRRSLLESQQLIYDSFVDPREAYADEDGSPWQALGSTPGGRLSSPAPSTETELTAARNACRELAVRNEYALSGHENRVSYLVGPGHRYTASP